LLETEFNEKNKGSDSDRAVMKDKAFFRYQPIKTYT